MPTRRAPAGELATALAAVAGWLDGEGAGEGESAAPARAELALAVRLSLRALAQAAPGATVEVRVPPFAAVQCVAGPRHTRGTPPNVIETDPRTWLELATARLTWRDALDSARLRASGPRADLSPWLPVIRRPRSAMMGDMTLSRFVCAQEEFDRRVRQVAPHQWHTATPCTEWDVRALVNHLVTEQMWAPLLLDGATVEDVGDRFDGDQLGEDPVRCWGRASAAAREAFAAPGALRRFVEVSSGRRPAEGYCQEMTLDLAVHAWDLARAIGVDERIDEELVGQLLAFVEPQRGQLGGTGWFAAPVAVGDDADAQTRLLALLGRRA